MPQECRTGQPLCADLAAVLAAWASRVGPSAAAQVQDARAALAEPVPRLAVGGRLKAGKSTLVNALLGAPLAGTGQTETTTLVTWFRHADVPEHEVVLRSGRRVVSPFDPSRGLSLDATVHAGADDEIDHRVVRCPSDVLASRFTVVDTPGLDSVTGLDPRSEAALAEADAVLFVMPHPGDGDESALLRIRDRAAAAGMTAANVLGVLSRVDQLGDGSADPWPDARRIAARYQRTLRGVVSDVIPVSGLLAQTALCGGVTAAHAQAVAALRALDPDDRADALYGEWEFRELDESPVGAEVRADLVARVGMYGLRELVASPAPAEPQALTKLLLELSGIDDLLLHVDASLLAGGDRLRCARVLAEVESTTWADGPEQDRAALAVLRTELQEFARRPRLLQIHLARALSDVVSGRWSLPSDDAESLHRLACGATRAACLGLAPDAAPEDLAAAADREIARWRRREFVATRRHAGHARRGQEMCQRLFFEPTVDDPGEAR